ncbi:MAG TPA: DJ-1/PfpI family protein [Rhizomicrobium sp.]|jgi:transcriptional regulator GlxA family with amidase domain|nr:DJ-1/PfpI family protein [Rhizomicrobium sp.]
MINAVMPVYDGCDLLDVAGPYEFFRWAGYSIRMVAERKGTVTCSGGVKITVDATYADAGNDNAFFWLPGGSPDAIAAMQQSTAMQSFLKTQAETVRYLASVCNGALILAQTGLLDGFEATTHWAFLPCFARYPQIMVAPGHPRFVIDRNRITGGGISSGLDESLEIIKLVSGADQARYVQRTTQYYPDPPVHSTIPVSTSCPVPT